MGLSAFRPLFSMVMFWAKKQGVHTGHLLRVRPSVFASDTFEIPSSLGRGADARRAFRTNVRDEVIFVFEGETHAEFQSHFASTACS